jgi:hypothetical protein
MGSHGERKVTNSNWKSHDVLFFGSVKVGVVAAPLDQHEPLSCLPQNHRRSPPYFQNLPCSSFNLRERFQSHFGWWCLVYRQRVGRSPRLDNWSIYWRTSSAVEWMGTPLLCYHSAWYWCWSVINISITCQSVNCQSQTSLLGVQLKAVAILAFSKSLIFSRNLMQEIPDLEERKGKGVLSGVVMYVYCTDLVPLEAVLSSRQSQGKVESTLRSRCQLLETHTTKLRLTIWHSKSFVRVASMLRLSACEYFKLVVLSLYFYTSIEKVIIILRGREEQEQR